MTKEELQIQVAELEECLCMLEDKLNVKKFKIKRADQILEILNRGKLISISEIASELDITNKNVSSVLCEIRDRGHEIVKVGRGHGKIKLMS